MARHLIVGAGMTGVAAARAIRERDGDAAITLVGAEPDPPYKRPPLTKGLWKGKPVESVSYDLADLGLDLRLGRRIVSLDLDARRATDDAGEEHPYDRLLLATGGSPRSCRARTRSSSARSRTTAGRARSPTRAAASPSSAVASSARRSPRRSRRTAPP